MSPPPTDTPEPLPPGSVLPEPVPPDLLEWARQTFDEQEYLDGVRDIETTGGHSFDAVIAAIEARVRGS